MIHVFFVIMMLSSKPIVGDLFEYSFDTMEHCRQYVESNPKKIAESVKEMRSFIDIPDGVPFEVAYGCRGKKETNI